MIGREPTVQEGQQFDQQLGKIVAGRLTIAVAPECVGVERSAARGAADAEVDAVRIERVQHAKGFRDFQRAVVRQQDGARADPNSRSFGGDAVNQNFRRGTGERGDRVMFSDPVTMIAKAVGQASKLDRIVQGVRRRIASRYCARP